MKKAYEIARVRGNLAHLQMMQTGQPAENQLLLQPGCMRAMARVM